LSLLPLSYATAACLADVQEAVLRRSGAPSETGLGGGGPRARRAAALRPTSTTAKSGLLLACSLVLFLLWQRALSWDQTSELYLHDAAITHELGPVGRPELLTGFVPPKRSSDGLTTDVEWDSASRANRLRDNKQSLTQQLSSLAEYSLFVKGQRLVIWSGEVRLIDCVTRATGLKQESCSS